MLEIKFEILNNVFIINSIYYKYLKYYYFIYLLCIKLVAHVWRTLNISILIYNSKVRCTFVGIYLLNLLIYYLFIYLILYKNYIYLKRLFNNFLITFNLNFYTTTTTTATSLNSEKCFGGVSFRKFLLHKFVFCCSAFRKIWRIIM